MRVLAKLLFLAFVLSIVSGDDKFVFNITLECGQPSFSYNIQFFEGDEWFGSDNQITKQRIGDAQRTAHFIEEGFQDGDQWFSSGYDVYMRLFHNCNEYKKDFGLTLHLKPQCKLDSGLCVFTIHKDIREAMGDMEYLAKLTHENP